jgi:1-acyl-sn-glycerol-3-phosphate acyltransferase
LLVKTIRNLRGLLTFSACTINTIVWFIPIFILGIVKMLLPVAAIRSVLSRWLMAFGDAWVSVNAWIFSVANDTTWDIRGTRDLSKRQWYLVIANHQTWVDIVVLQTVFNGQIPFLKFFIKQQLVWFPFLGVAFWALDMPFMKRYSKSYLARHPEKKGQDLAATRRACEKFRDAPTSVINFVEGTRFTPEKQASRGSPYEHLLMPRAGGVALALASMGEMFDAILDVTIVYPNSPPAFWAMMCGEFDHVIVDIRHRPVEAWLISDGYQDDRQYRKDFHGWLAGLWSEKDARIRKLQRPTD